MYRAPISAEQTENASRNQPIHSSGLPISQIKRTSAYRPALWMTPDISADTCAGAAAWARGSQEWNGKNADFSPKLVTSSRNTRLRSELGLCRSQSPKLSSAHEPECVYRIMKAATRKISPMWVDTR